MAKKAAAADKSRAKAQGLTELGDSGTRILDGVVSEEYNAKLQDVRGIAVYDEMRKSDGTVRSLVLAVTLPVRAANWFIKPASEEAQDQEIAEFVKAALFDAPKFTFDDFLRHALLSLPLGVMPFEKVFEVRPVDGKERIAWSKLAPRMPRSIQKWAIAGGAFGITQNTSEGKPVEIPGDKLIVFVNEMEGENWWGTSILRAPYKHWFIKNNIYKVDAIAFERQGLGVPYVKLPETPTPSDVAKAETILKNLRANSHAYIVEPHDYEIGFKDMQAGGTRDPQNSIAHHNREIMKSGLAQFLELGAASSAGSSGSRALSEDHSDLFLQSLEAAARNFASTFNKQGIKELVDLNFDNVKKYPALDFEGITETDAKKLSDAFKTLVDTGAVTPQDADETYFRDLLNLPEFDEAGRREKPAAKITIPPEQDPEEAAVSERLSKKKEFAEDGFKPYRALTFAEGKVNFEGLQKKIDELEAQFDKETAALLHEARDAYMKAFARAAHAGDAQAIKDATLKVQNDLARIIKNASQSAFVYGKNNAANELGVDAPANPSAALKQIDIQAAAIADQQITEITSDSKNAYVESLNKGASTTQALAAADAAAAAAIDRVTRNASSILMAGHINYGRGVMFDREGDKVYALQRSELLDFKTCNYCLSIDGRVFEKSDPQFSRLGPVHSNCRGINVAILTDEHELPKISGIPQSLRSRIGETVNDVEQPKSPITKKNSPAREEADKREDRKQQ
ncbi:hypothetical protein GGQ85_003616 [Nitrobacter vulgaris]|uniref:phage portal protein family protein n=1 Tax=Nitrobacter vulgaris TaxID=29421 RepID=UPI0028679645|nr:DUF935 family protein [Nitrobacter vulgaris]MDR6305890.1 hypothetical protein [Nitrobacter vulgaris]